MKKIVSVLAIILAIALVATLFLTRHSKDEIAYEIGGREFTSAMYSCVLYTAATNARNTIYSYVKEAGEDTTKIKYETYKFDENGVVSPLGTITYEDFVKKEALRVLRQYAAVLNSMEAKGITLDDETKEVASVQAYCYWNFGCDYSTYISYSQYGQDISNYYTPYYYLFTPNGVAYETYEQYMIYEYSYNYYFYELYGEGGEKEIPKADLEKYFGEHYTLGDSFSYSLVDADKKDLTEDEKKILTDEATAFAERLSNGESFDVIFEEFKAAEKKREDDKKADKENSEENKDDKTEDKTETENKTEDDKSEDKTEDKTETEDNKDEGYKPKDYTSLFGDADSEYASSHYETVKGLEVGKATVITDAENKVIIVVQRRELLEENGYWLNEFEGNAGVMRDNIIYNLKHEEFDNDITALGMTYEAKEDTHATRPFKVKKLKFDLEA